MISLTSLFLITLNSVAFNYSVSFTGHGASTDVTSVLVQNITQGTSVSVTAGQVLILAEVQTGVNNTVSESYGDIVSFNDTEGHSVISFNINQAGKTILEIYHQDGRKAGSIATDLNVGKHRYKLSLPRGLYIAHVRGNGFEYTTKLISKSNGNNDVRIVPDGVEEALQSSAKRVKASEISMSYASGDRIIFRGYSENMCTIVSDVISADKTIDFNFVPCQDANGNHYATISIGNQVWMAENLKTTKYADGSDIILRASKAEYLADSNNNTTPVCRYFNDDANTKDVAGLAYKYQTIQKDLCPSGWHIPSHLEWRILRDAISLNQVERYNSIRQTGPYWNNTGATNASGFSAVATGTFWAEWPIHNGTWAIWLASDLWNNDPNNCWFFYAATDDNLTSGSIVCDEIASDAFAMFGAIRCVKND
jgi:uncharacterized protein (TIGR02145 family)